MNAMLGNSSPDENDWSNKNSIMNGGDPSPGDRNKSVGDSLYHYEAIMLRFLYIKVSKKAP